MHVNHVSELRVGSGGKWLPQSAALPNAGSDCLITVHQPSTCSAATELVLLTKPNHQTPYRSTHAIPLVFLLYTTFTGCHLLSSPAQPTFFIPPNPPNSFAFVTPGGGFLRPPRLHVAHRSANLTSLRSKHPQLLSLHLRLRSSPREKQARPSIA